MASYDNFDDEDVDYLIDFKPFEHKKFSECTDEKLDLGLKENYSVLSEKRGRQEGQTKNAELDGCTLTPKKLKISWNHLLESPCELYGTFEKRLEAQLPSLEPHHLVWHQYYPARVITEKDKFIYRCFKPNSNQVLLEYFPYDDNKLWIQGLADKKDLVPYFGKSDQKLRWCDELIIEYTKINKKRKKHKIKSVKKWTECLKLAQTYLDRVLERISNRDSEEFSGYENCLPVESNLVFMEKPLKSCSHLPVDKVIAHSSKRVKDFQKRINAGDVIIYCNNVFGNTPKGRRETRVIRIFSAKDNEHDLVELENGECISSDQLIAIYRKWYPKKGKYGGFYKQVDDLHWMSLVEYTLLVGHIDISAEVSDADRATTRDIAQLNADVDRFWENCHQISSSNPV